MACKMETEKVCTMANVIVERKKKAKHHHTTGIFKNARECAALGSFACRLTAWVRMASLFHTNNAKMLKNTQAAATYAVRQSYKLLMPTIKRGATAQPRLPVNPCALKAYPNLAEDTLWLRMVKSTGWKEALPTPNNAAATINPP